MLGLKFSKSAKKKGSLDDGGNRKILGFDGRRYCKGCKIVLTDVSESKLDDRFCRWCRPVKSVDDV